MLKRLDIDPEFQSLIPPLTPDEYKQLEENLVAEGCRDKLVVWEDVIIDGHNRYEICHKHGIYFEVKEMYWDERNEAIEWIIRNQFGRRNLGLMQRGELILTLEDVVKELAKQRMLAGKKTDPQTNSSKGTTRSQLAKEAGMGEGTLYQVKKIKEEGTPEQIERARIGNKGNTVNAVYEEIVKSKKQSEEKKVCTCCGESKPLSDFQYKKTERRYEAMCKKCKYTAKTVKFDLDKPESKMDDIDKLYREMKKPAPVEPDTGVIEEVVVNPIISDFEQMLKEFDKNVNKFVYADFKLFGLTDPSELEKFTNQIIEDLTKILNNLGELSK